MDKAFRSLRLTLPFLLSSFLLCGCADKTNQQPTDEEPVYSGCIILYEQGEDVTGEDFITLAYEIHLRKPMTILHQDPALYFDEVLEPDVWVIDSSLTYDADSYASTESYPFPPYCGSEEYPYDWSYSEGSVHLNKEHIPDLLKKLEALPIRISFKDKETDRIYEYEDLFPVIVISE